MAKLDYYNPNRILSYNNMMNMVLGGRNIGKTYGFTVFLVRRFIEYGEEFIYLRRHKDDLKHIEKFFDAIKIEFPDVEFKVNGYKLMIDGYPAGKAIILSKWQSVKGSSFKQVKWILYDEFLVEKSYMRYIPDEPRSLLNFLHSVDREREDKDKVKLICLANAVSLTNPYFVFFNLTPDPSKEFHNFHERELVVQFPNSDELLAQTKDRPLRKLIAGTDYEQFAVNNQFEDNNTVFISKRSKKSKHVFGIKWKNESYGLWVDVDQGLLYCSRKTDKTCRYFYALTTDDFLPNTMLLNDYKNNMHLNKMMKAFRSGLLMFEDIGVRSAMYEVFRKMNIR